MLNPISGPLQRRVYAESKLAHGISGVSNALTADAQAFHVGSAVQPHPKFGSIVEPPAKTLTLSPQVQRFETLMQEKLKGKVKNFKLDRFQVEAMQHLVDGKSVLVSAPTSSGKTMVGGFAIERALNPDYWPSPDQPPKRRRVFYTTPRKAISNEKRQDFAAEYQDEKYQLLRRFLQLSHHHGQNNVGLMTGDVTLNPDAPLVLMTTEVLRNIQYEEPERLADVATVVEDETHFLNDRERGPVYEECNIHLPPEIQTVHLSATIGNPEVFVAWKNSISTRKTELVYEDKRPVPLKYIFYNPATKNIEPVFDDGSRHPRNSFKKAFSKSHEGYSQLDVQHAVARYQEKTKINLYPIVETVYSKRLIDQAFSEMAKSLPPAPRLGHITTRPDPKTDPEGDRLFQLRELIREQQLVDPDLSSMNPELIRGLMHGYGKHHAGMTYAERGLVEKAQKAGLLKMTWATDTLAAGINTVERTAFIPRLNKFNGQEFTSISPSDFQQALGRAGRRGIFETGYALLAPPENASPDTLAQTMELIFSEPEDLVSQFKPLPTMMLKNFIKSPSLEKARAVIGKSLAAFQARTPQWGVQAFNDTLALLEDLNLVKLSGKGGTPTEARLTALGREMSSLPDTAFASLYTLLKGTIQTEALVEKNRTDAEPLASRAELQARLGPRTRSLALLEKLEDHELAALVSATLNERGDNPRPTGRNTFDFMTVANAFVQETRNLTEEAEQIGITNQSPINFTFAPYIAEWAQTGSGFWKETRRRIEGSGLYIGDFMNIARRTANVCQKLSEFNTLPDELRRKFRTARHKLLQRPLKESIMTPN